MENVAITGMGVISSLGQSIADFGRNQFISPVSLRQLETPRERRAALGLDRDDADGGT